MKTFDRIRYAHELVLFQGESENDLQSSECPKSLWPVPAEMFRLFEEITGWVVDFQESTTSYHQRRVLQSARSNSRCLQNLKRQVAAPDQKESSETLPIADGFFTISDMSDQWPAGRPTSHRAKCEQFLEIMNQFLHQVKCEKLQLQQAKSLLASDPPANFSIDPDDILTDAFPSRYPYDTATESEQDFVVTYHNRRPSMNDLQTVSSDSIAKPSANETHRSDQFDQNPTKFETRIHQNADRWQRTGFAAMSKWQLGGGRGMLENRYIDWTIENDGRIELIQGKIDRNSQSCEPNQCRHSESRLILNPSTAKFWLSGDSQGRFWIYDQNSNTMTSVPEKLCKLQLGQAIICSTSSFLRSQPSFFRIQQSFSADHADQIAKNIQESIGAVEPVLVLARIN